MRLRTKMLISLGSSLLAAGLLISGYFGTRVADTMVASSKANLAAQLQVLSELMDAYRLQTEQLANDHFRALAQRLAGRWSVHPEATTLTAGKAFPTLKLDAKPVNNDETLPDRFTESMGSVATLFVRAGDDFARVTTSLKNAEGKRAVGTLLDRQHPAYQALLAGKPYVGRARLFGRDFMTRYEAIKDEKGAVIGALFVGVDFTQSCAALKDSIGKMRVGHAGYFFALDTAPGQGRGGAMIHPEVAGQNLLAKEGANAAAAAVFAEVGEQAAGQVDYPWTGKAGTETRYAAFHHYAPWQMQLFASIAREEVTRPAWQAGLQLAAVMLLSLSLITVFVVWLVNRLVIRPLGGEPADAAAAVRRIAQGDLSAHLPIVAGDTESLMASLSQMQRTLGALVDDIHQISDAAASRGDFSVKIDVAGKAGFMAELATLLNTLSNVTETGLCDISRVAQALAEGDLSQQIAQSYPGLFGQTTSSVNRTVAALSQIVAAIRNMVAAATAGDFSVRLDADGQRGYARELSLLLNQLSTTTDEGLQAIRAVAQALAAGDLSQTVRADFPGVFGQTTASVNQTVQALTQIVEDIRSMVAAANAGDFSVKIAQAGKQGYTRELSGLLNQLSDVTEAGLTDIRRVASALSAGDLTQTVSRPYPGIFGETTEGMNRTVAKLSELIEGVQQSVASISHAAHELAAGNRDLSTRTEEQASSLEETASSMAELTQTVQENLAKAQHANTLAQGANAVAGQGGVLVERVVDTMREIQESSRKIADILSLIDGIAFQTNILALNAAVEAARAGEHGRGFAVVASEVRVLAQRSATASRDIKALIGASVERITCGATQVADAGATMREVVGSVQAVSTLIEAIHLASLEQGSGIEQVARAVTQMDEVTQQNASLVEEASAATESLDSQARGLQQAVSLFRLKEAGERSTKRLSL
ncbi:MAG: hypothetical protein RJA63_1254 [Pseudomonadota bacterium]|jgi:methyl-accepting chemotaxis protein